MTEEERTEAQAEHGEGLVDPAPSGLPADELADAARGQAAALEDELEVLQAALGRLEEGSYGRCERCGAVLDDTLLEADPAASRCLAHASI